MSVDVRQLQEQNAAESEIENNIYHIENHAGRKQQNLGPDRQL